MGHPAAAKGAAAESPSTSSRSSKTFTTENGLPVELFLLTLVSGEHFLQSKTRLAGPRHDRHDFRQPWVTLIQQR